MTPCQNVASIGIFYRYYSGQCATKLTEMFSQPRSYEYPTRLF